MAKAKKKKIQLWTKKEITTLRKLFPNNSTAKVAGKFGRSVSSVMHKATRLKLKKTKKYLKSIGKK
ncbi:hypothetical protein ACFL1G_12225 [Planctomycetota bacterium]